MGNWLRKQVDGEDPVGPLTDYGPWPRRGMIWQTVDELGECPVMKETERGRKGEGRNGSRDTREN